MSERLSARAAAGFATLLLIALLMAANHVSARLAFQHGVDVPTAVTVRSLGTALVVGLLLHWQQVPLALNARQRKALPLIGALIAVQSLWLYSAVARLPVALALLVFNSFPLMTALWARVLYQHRPERTVLIAMPVILLGLVLALDVLGAASGLGAAGQWHQIGAGVAFALGAAATFGLALVEVAAYKLPDSSTLLQPRVLAKTELLQRTLLMGPSGPVTLQQAAQAEDASDPSPASRAWFQTFWAAYLTKLRLDDPALVPAEPAKSTNQFIPMPPGGASAWVSAYVAQSSGKGGVYLTFAKAFEPGLEWYEQLQADAESIEREVGAKLQWERAGDKVYLGVPTVALGDLNAPADRERVTAYLADMTRRLVGALKPRLEAMSAADK